MSEQVTLDLPNELARNAREVAERTHRRVEDVLLEWLGRAAKEIPVEELPDEQVLVLADTQLSNEQQIELSNLLTHQREGALDDSGRARLDALMSVYRRGMVRKAQALQVAVSRGLRPALT